MLPRVLSGESAGSKRCKKCGETRPAAEFTKDKHAPDGLNRKCRGCVNAQSRAYHERNKERVLERNKAWREAHAEEVAARKAWKYQQEREWCVYRITTDDRKIYIGSSAHAAKRLAVHRHGSRSGRHRNPGLRAYSPDRLSFEVLAVYPSMKEAHRAEREEIEATRARLGDGCLNVHVPWDGTCKYRGKKS